MTLNSLDLVIIGIYGAVLFAIAIFVSRAKGGAQSTEGYFLASKALPWWAIGASLVAANISAEQIIGQSGQGYVVGIAIAAYEWQAAVVLVVVAKYFLPIFLKRGIYTMPQFLEQRYGGGVRTLMSAYWLLLYTTVNLTTVLWLGGLAIASLLEVDVVFAMGCPRPVRRGLFGIRRFEGRRSDRYHSVGRLAARGHRHDVGGSRYGGG